MSAGEIVNEVAAALTAAGDGTLEEVTLALIDERVELGATGPSGRVWAVSRQGGDAPVWGPWEAILSLVDGGGLGLVARIDDGPWRTVRTLTLPSEAAA